MSTYFFWKGFLILALGQPAVLKPNGSVLWVSSKDSLKVQSQPSQVTLFPQRKDFVFISGFDIGKKEPIPTLITTHANLLALQKCPNTQNIEIIDQKLTFISKNLENFPTECGYDDIRFIAVEKTPLAKETNKQLMFIEKKLQRDGIKTGIASWISGKRHLAVNSSLNPQEILEKIPLPYRNFYELNLRQSAAPGKNLIFQLTLFEFSRQKARKMGLKWPQSVSVYSINNLGNRNLNLQDLTSGTASEILIQGDFGESQGIGKVLAQPTLRTQAGVESRFLSGGEFPVKNSNAFQSQTTWKSYGLKVSLTPHKDSEVGDTEVSLDFKLEFSEPNMEHAVDGIPSLVQRQLESRFDIRTDETTILTSMITLREGHGKSGVAFLSQIPILGLLAGQDSKLSSDSELWFALKPTWEEIPMKSANRKAQLDFSL